jgi:MerR family transcriptional regulator, copper efflux regulator
MIAMSEAARRLALTPRALRYREALGLVPVRHGSGRHRRFTESDIAAVHAALAIEQEYHVGPSEVAFALRALQDPRLAARLRALGDIPSRVLEFEQAKAERLLAGT